MDRRNGFTVMGAVLAVAGIAGLAIPVFIPQSAGTVAKLGDLNLQGTEDAAHRIPQYVSGGLVALGLAIMGTSLGRKR